MTIPICPHCGDADECVYARAKPRGSAKEYFYPEDGESAGIDLSDGLFFDPVKTVRCGRCHKIRRDLTVIDGRVVQKHG
jgi:cytochrome c peroxidase